MGLKRAGKRSKNKGRLRNKIIMVSCMAVLFSLLIGDAFVSAAYYKNAWKGGKNSAYHNTRMLLSNMQTDEILTKVMDKNSLAYFFKLNNADIINPEYNLCYIISDENGSLEVPAEVYNHTVFSYDEISGLEYWLCDNWGVSYDIQNSDAKYTMYKWNGSHYMIIRMTIGDDGNVELFHIEDMTYVWEDTERIVLLLLALTAFLTIIMGNILTVVLRYILAPLDVLSDAARAMADNVYDRRVKIKQKDEIGELAESFNSMADAVSMHMKSLEESENKKTLLIGSLTHEMKTPVTAISGYAETLLSTKLSEEDKEEALQYIYEESVRLERLSKKLMKLFSLDNGTEEFTFANITAEKLFDSVKHSCTGALESKNILLECRENGEEFFVEPDLISELLINLVDNAIRASVENGKIILCAEGDVISVSDFGYGIPDEEIEHILEPFYMVDKSRSHKYGGVGLGLSIARNIAKLHNIKIEISSKVGEGTTVTLQFKRKAAA